MKPNKCHGRLALLVVMVGVLTSCGLEVVRMDVGRHDARVQALAALDDVTAAATIAEVDAD